MVPLRVSSARSRFRRVGRTVAASDVAARLLRGGLHGDGAGSGAADRATRAAAAAAVCRAGAVRLVGLETGTIVREANHLLQNPEAHAEMAVAVNPYGDGLASRRIVSILLGENWQEFRP